MFFLKVDDEIYLSLLGRNDAGELFSLTDQSRDYLKRWLPWVDQMRAAHEYVPIIELWHQQFSNGTGLHTGIYYRGNLAGVIGFHDIDWSNASASIGYWLAEQFQGKGIMTKAADALICYAFRTLGLHRIEIRCGEENYKSRAIPERLGFKKEGMIRDGEWLNGRFHNLIVYGMIRNDWI